MKYKHSLATSIAFAVLVGSSPAMADDYPSKPIKIVVPFTPGGVTDASARLIAKKLGTELNQPIVVENRPGAGASIGANMVAKAPADGYTLLIGTLANMVVNPHVYKEALPYKPLTDFAPVYGVMDLPLVIVSSKKQPIKDLDTLVKLAKEKPGTISYGSSGVGSVSHLAAELFQSVTGTKLVHVPYKGSSAITSDLIGGNLDIGFDYASSTATFIRAGQLNGLAVTGKQEIGMLPGVHTTEKLGYRGVDVTSWVALFAPAKTPTPVLNKLSLAMSRVLRDKETIDGLVNLGGQPLVLGPKDLGKLVQNDFNRWKPIIEKADIKPN